MSKRNPKPPAAPEVERAVLGAMFVNPDAVERALAILGRDADVFTDDLCRAVYVEAIRVHDAGQPAALDPVLIAQRFPGQVTAVAELAGASPTSHNVEHYAREVRKSWCARRRMDLGHRLTLAAADGNEEACRAIEAELAALGTDSTRLCYAQWPEDWVSQAEKPLPWLIPDWLLRETVTVLGAEGGTGKSFLALGLAVSAATGTTLFKGFAPITRTPVLFVDLENTARTVARRINHIRRRYALDVEHLTESMRNQLHLVQQRGSFIEPLPSGRAWMETPFFRQVLADARRIKPGLIIIDHLRRAAGQAEGNNNELMGSVIEKCDILARESGAAVLVLAHTNKAAANNRARQTNIRGAGAITDEARCAWEMRRDEKTGDLALTCTKSNEGPTGATLHFRMAPLAEHGVCIELVDAPPMQEATAAPQNMLDVVAAGLDRFHLTMQEVWGHGPTPDQFFRKFLDDAFGGKTNRAQRVNWVNSLLDSGEFVKEKQGRRQVIVRAPEYAGGEVFDSNPHNHNPHQNPHGVGSETHTDGTPLIGGGNLCGFPSPDPNGVCPSRPCDPPPGLEQQEEPNVLPFHRPDTLAAPPPPDADNGPLFGESYTEDDEDAFF